MLAAAPSSKCKLETLLSTPWTQVDRVEAILEIFRVEPDFQEYYGLTNPVRRFFFLARVILKHKFGLNFHGMLWRGERDAPWPRQAQPSGSTYAWTV